MIIIPIYYANPAQYQVIKTCIHRVEEHYPGQLFVIDDASPLEHDFPVNYRNPENLGYSATVNKAIKLIDDECFVVMNSDIWLKEGDLDWVVTTPDYRGIFCCQDSCGTEDVRFGSIFATNKLTWNDLGGFDERLRNYFSDSLMLQTCKELGVPVVKDFSTVVEHLESQTFKHLNKSLLFQNDAKVYNEITWNE